ncbi:MAG: carboxylating nicotinate-nucleotide diphosphorylase [candidate division Zixibacteria bacterium]|nr:carboxylating nicotinate-nucleotide diphosphorylase [candidate division Zixibacteria bacterium]
MDKISQQVIKLAYQEDIQSGDITSEATIRKRLPGKALIIAKSSGILSGTEAFRYAFKLASPKIKVVFHIRDGNKYSPEDKIATIKGISQALLRGERLALNLLSHLSGVATMTSMFVARVDGLKARILDTRKTTPGIRYLEKRAVKHGGGRNHRMGLYDMVLIKDNHIAAAGGVGEALEKVLDIRRKVEIEIADFYQLETALNYSPDIIMLDNFNIRRLAWAVKIIRSSSQRIKIEASGGVNLKTVRSIAKTGVDYISVGALTHSVPAADFSMRYV